MTTAPPVRVAARNGTCPAPGCEHPQIEPGMPIIKPPGRAWRHVNCQDRRGRRRRAR
jgi:hypothetical protein